MKNSKTWKQNVHLDLVRKIKLSSLSIKIVTSPNGPPLANCFTSSSASKEKLRKSADKDSKITSILILTAKIGPKMNRKNFWTFKTT